MSVDQKILEELKAMNEKLDMLIKISQTNNSLSNFNMSSPPLTQGAPSQVSDIKKQVEEKIQAAKLKAERARADAQTKIQASRVNND